LAAVARRGWATKKIYTWEWKKFAEWFRIKVGEVIQITEKFLCLIKIN
jgi:hypothetical protein